MGETGEPLLSTTDADNIDASNASNIRASTQDGVPERTGYTGYLVGDGFPVNGLDFGFGIQFPAVAMKDDFFLRTDFLPNRLFRFDGLRWVKVEDAVRMNMTNNDSRNTQKTDFINNNSYMYTDKVTEDAVTLTKGISVINTTIDFAITAPYVVLKIDTYTMEYAVADYPTMRSSYSYTSPTGVVSNKIRITLPVLGSVQQTIPYDGVWTATLYNVRMAQKQSLSKALRPRADL